MIYFKFAKQTTNSKSTNKLSLFEKIIKCLLFFIPKSNPDFEYKYPFVSTWYIEYNDSKDFANREIGLNKNNRIIVRGPWKKNLGFWTDSDLLFDDYKKWEIEVITPEEFNTLWEA